MTITVVRQISAAGVWASNRKAVRFASAAGTVAPGTGIKIVRSGSGPAGRDAAQDFGVGFENFAAGQLLNTVPLAHALTATNAVSRAYTETPPATVQQVVTLLDKGVVIGTATFAVGANDGSVSLTSGSYTFPAGGFPRFQTPSPLDTNFSHFAITYAGP